jgi:glycosyltransferase involved in cell wall biosynthesis
MRILIAAIGHYTEMPSGSARVAWDEALAFAKREHEVWVLAASRDVAAPRYEIVRGVHLLRFSPQRHPVWHPSRSSEHASAAREVLQKYLPNVDLIHGHVPLAASAAADFYGPHVPMAYTLHSPSRLEMAIEWCRGPLGRRMLAPIGLALINRMERKCLDRSSVITALSKYTVSLAAQCHSAELAGRIQVIPGWADSDRFIPVDDVKIARRTLGWDFDAPVFFTLRRLVSRMGLDRLLHAAAALRREGLRFQVVIGGTGPQAAKLADLAHRLELDSTVQFLGRVRDDDLPLTYGACDAFILPTAELECFGLIALEALSAGRPVLATPVGAIPEILEPLERQWLANSATAEDIASLMRDFLKHRLPSHSPHRLHRYVVSTYNHATLVSQLLDTISSAADHALACDAG